MLLYIALGGASGAVARYSLGGWIQARFDVDFPVGTLVINVIGSLLIGFFLHYIEVTQLSSEVRALISIGLLGAFTTFSAFSYEVVALIETGAWNRAIGYAGGSLLLGIAAVYSGIAISTHLLATTS